jgi:hypothetical protein
MRMTRLLLAAILCLSNLVAAQIIACAPEAHTLPDDLRTSLDARLATFLTAQTEGRWEEVEGMFGDKDVVHESSYRECLVSRMRELRMVSFDLSSPDLYTCTAPMDLPAGIVDRVTAERLSWYVRGTGRFQTSADSWSEETQVKAYRDRGQWYFIPPQRRMQDKWEKAHYTEADFMRDRQEEIEVRNSPSSPLEIVGVHVYMKRQFPSLRTVHYKLRNLTAKKIVWFSMKIRMTTNVPGETDWQGPYQIEPRGQIAGEQDTTAYGDFCNGISKNEMLVDEIHFADGSKWKLKEPEKAK